MTRVFLRHIQIVQFPINISDGPSVFESFISLGWQNVVSSWPYNHSLVWLKSRFGNHPSYWFLR